MQSEIISLIAFFPHFSFCYFLSFYQQKRTLIKVVEVKSQNSSELVSSFDYFCSFLLKFCIKLYKQQPNNKNVFIIYLSSCRSRLGEVSCTTKHFYQVHSGRELQNSPRKIFKLKNLRFIQLVKLKEAVLVLFSRFCTFPLSIRWLSFSIERFIKLSKKWNAR